MSIRSKAAAYFSSAVLSPHKVSVYLAACLQDFESAVATLILDLHNQLSYYDILEVIDGI